MSGKQARWRVDGLSLFFSDIRGMRWTPKSLLHNAYYKMGKAAELMRGFVTSLTAEYDDGSCEYTCELTLPGGADFGGEVLLSADSRSRH